MAVRAIWKGYLKIAELTCAVALHTAVSSSERIAFHILNRKTGHRLRRHFVDEDSGKPVDAKNQVKGYEVAKGKYTILEPEEITAVIPESDKTLNIEKFIPCADIDTVYFDRPYYLTPGDAAAAEAYAVIREGLRTSKVAALAKAVLFRRIHTVLIRAHDQGLIATILNYNYEVRSAKDAFSSVPKMKIKGEMLDLAKHIIDTKKGKFDLSGFDDRYDSAVAELVRAKQEGRPIEKKKPAKAGKIIDLMQALRESAEKKGRHKSAPSKRKTSHRKSASRQAGHLRKAG